MKILMTNWRTTWFSGSDTYLFTVGEELIKRGHKVTVFTEHAGLAGRYFEDIGIRVLNKLPNKNTWELDTEHEFDIIHGHHNSTLRIVDERYPEIPKIFVSHGVLPRQESPPKGVVINKYIAVSEEVQKNQFTKKNLDSEIIRQPINLEKYYPLKGFKFRKKKLRIVAISNYFGGEYEGNEIRNAVKKIGGELNLVGSNGIMTKNTAEYLQKADIVIGLGRGILESMACGKPVIVGDYNGYDGAICNEELYFKFRKNNLSGRCFRLQHTEDDLVKIINRLVDTGLRKIGEQNRLLIEKFHNSKEIVTKFEEMYKNYV